MHPAKAAPLFRYNLSWSGLIWPATSRRPRRSCISRELPKSAPVRSTDWAIQQVCVAGVTATVGPDGPGCPIFDVVVRAIAIRAIEFYIVSREGARCAIAVGERISLSLRFTGTRYRRRRCVTGIRPRTTGPCGTTSVAVLTGVCWCRWYLTKRTCPKTTGPTWRRRCYPSWRATRRCLVVALWSGVLRTDPLRR